jgi:hypothetical protein
MSTSRVQYWELNVEPKKAMLKLSVELWNLLSWVVLNTNVRSSILRGKKAMLKVNIKNKNSCENNTFEFCSKNNLHKGTEIKFWCIQDETEKANPLRIVDHLISLSSYFPLWWVENKIIQRTLNYKFKLVSYSLKVWFTTITLIPLGWMLFLMDFIRYMAKSALMIWIWILILTKSCVNYYF